MYICVAGNNNFYPEKNCTTRVCVCMSVRMCACIDAHVSHEQFAITDMRKTLAQVHDAASNGANQNTARARTRTRGHYFSRVIIGRAGARFHSRTLLKLELKHEKKQKIFSCFPRAAGQDN